MLADVGPYYHQITTSCPPFTYLNTVACCLGYLQSLSLSVTFLYLPNSLLQKKKKDVARNCGMPDIHLSLMFQNSQNAGRHFMQPTTYATSFPLSLLLILCSLNIPSPFCLFHFICIHLLLFIYSCILYVFKQGR